jgi:hypothetical protein
MFGGRVFQLSAYLWLQTVLLFSPICSFIRMRQISYRGFSRKTKRRYSDEGYSRNASCALNLTDLRFYYTTKLQCLCIFFLNFLNFQKIHLMRCEWFLLTNLKTHGSGKCRKVKCMVNEFFENSKIRKHK